MRCLSALAPEKKPASATEDASEKLATTVRALVMVHQHVEVDEAISNPVMKSLVKYYRKFHALTDARP
eukprot:5550454-Pyramimonas_sp.AAC.1